MSDGLLCAIARTVGIGQSLFCAEKSEPQAAKEMIRVPSISPDGDPSFRIFYSQDAVSIKLSSHNIYWSKQTGFIHPGTVFAAPHLKRVKEEALELLGRAAKNTATGSTWVKPNPALAAKIAGVRDFLAKQEP